MSRATISDYSSLCQCKKDKKIEQAFTNKAKATTRLTDLLDELRIESCLCVVCDRTRRDDLVRVVNSSPRKYMCLECINNLKSTPGNTIQSPSEYLAAHVIAVAPGHERGHPAPKRRPSDSKCSASDPALTAKTKAQRSGPGNVARSRPRYPPRRAYDYYHGGPDDRYNTYDDHEHDDHHQNEEGMADYCRNDGQGRY
jgi:hypothetical protein